MRRGRLQASRETSLETRRAQCAPGSRQSSRPPRVPVGGTPRCPWCEESGAHHADAQFRKIGAVGGHEIREPYRAHPRRRAGEDEVAGLELPGSREMHDDLRDIPDEIAHLTLLAAHAVDI